MNMDLDTFTYTDRGWVEECSKKLQCESIKMNEDRKCITNQNYEYIQCISSFKKLYECEKYIMYHLLKSSPSLQAHLPSWILLLHTGHYTGTVDHRLCYYCDLGEEENGIHCIVHSTMITEKYYLIEFQYGKACSRIEVLLNLFFDNHMFAISSVANT